MGKRERLQTSETKSKPDQPKSEINGAVYHRNVSIKTLRHLLEESFSSQVSLPILERIRKMSDQQEQTEYQSRNQIDYQKYAEFQAYDQLRQQEQQRLIEEQQRVIDDLESRGYEIRNRRLVGEIYSLISNPPRIDGEAERIEKAAATEKALREYYRKEYEEEQRMLKYQQQVGYQPDQKQPQHPNSNPYQAMSMQGSGEVRNNTRNQGQNSVSAYERGQAAAAKRRAEWEKMRGG